MVALDITPRLPAGRQLIESYGNGGFKISGRRFAGSVVVFPERVAPWPGAAVEAVTASALQVLLAPLAAPLQYLVIGCGRTFVAPPPALIAELRLAGIAAEWMDTGAACRTYNVLLYEGRDVAAALIAVD